MKPAYNSQQEIKKGQIKVEVFSVKVKRIFCYMVLSLITIMSLFSFYILIINTTRSHVEIQRGFSMLPGVHLKQNIENILKNPNLPVLTSLRNSLFISASVAILSTYFSALTAYGIYAYDFKFKKQAYAFILMIMMIPTQVSALGFINLITRMDLMDSFVPLIVPSIAAPAVFYFMIQYMESVLSLQLIESSRIDGAGEFRTFNQIVLPILKPAIAVQAIFAFVGTWNNYFIPALVLSSDNKKTIPILIAQLRGADYMKFDMGQVYALIAVAIIPVIIIYLFLSRYIISGITAGSVKG